MGSGLLLENMVSLAIMSLRLASYSLMEGLKSVPTMMMGNSRIYCGAFVGVEEALVSLFPSLSSATPSDMRRS